MSLAWYVNRLARMGPAEIAHRVLEQGRRRLSRTTKYGWASFASEGPMPVLPSLAERLAAAPEPLRQAVRAAADQVLAGRYTALGVTWPPRGQDQLFPPGLWRLDPVSGDLWPGAERFCFDIGYRHERAKGDVKYVWEMNRLQILQPLAAAYALFGDRRALAATVAALESWMDANPPFQGLGWNSGIEVALRATSILIASSLCGPALDAAVNGRLRTALAAHLFWIRRYPSRFSSANNHAIAELMGTYLTAVSLGGARMQAVARRAAQALAREAGLQFTADGVPAEQSPTYGAFSAEMLLLCAEVAAARGDPLPPPVRERLGRFADFVEALADATGRVPAIGDDDEGRVISLGTPEPRYAASVARAISGHLGRPAMAWTDVEAQLRDGLLASGTKQPQDSGAGLVTFPDGGYTVVRAETAGRRLHLVMDHGPLGYLSIAAHGHADANAITLSLDDRPVLVDPGTYLYHSGGAWRDWFRSTRAHNTLSIADGDQSQILGPFNWGRRATATLDRVDAGPDWSVAARHDGYREGHSVDHRRTLLGAADHLVIHDELLPATAVHPVEVVFQLAPGLAATARDGEFRVTRDGQPLLTLAFDHPGTLKVEQGSPGFDGGWVSPRFGEKVAAPRLSWRGDLPPAGLRTTLRICRRPDGSGASPDP